MSEWIPDDDWTTIVENVPIVSVDLLVECPDGFILGKRANQPAKGEWFVPGGRVRKNERLNAAVHRIAAEELGTDVDVRRSLGVFDHLYDDSEVGVAKHYVAHGYHVWADQTTFEAYDQHDALATFDGAPPDAHEYVEAYFDALRA